jgi:hypothetical protein
MINSFREWIRLAADRSRLSDFDEPVRRAG